MIQEYQIRILPEQAANEEGIKRYLAKEKGLDARTLNKVRVLKRSIDARQRTIFVNLKVRAYINEMPQDDQYVHTEYPDVSSRPRVIVVGEGPGGLFASLRLIELGYRPVVLERGKDVRERKKDLSNITKTQKVDSESNYCFGEGGAGAYSDGKLYTRSKKRGSVDKILNVFCQHGANTNILADAHPHIGTDKLPRVIENMRNTIINCGGEVHFQTKMTRFILEGDRVIGVEAVNLATGAEENYRGPVILATGHSARDVYRYLASSKIEIEAKGIAVGVRLEHPSQLIDQIQYHNRNGRGKYLPAAEYSFVTQVDGRGVYSFCMCPGGVLVPSETEPETIVMNGMSNSARSGKFANAGVVVQINPEDIPEEYADKGAFAGLEFQKDVERKMWEYAHEHSDSENPFVAPAQRMVDFCEGEDSEDLPETSYKPGVVPAPLHEILPQFIAERLQDAFPIVNQKSMRGYYTNDALLIGVESRTSSPVRIPRNPRNCEADAFPGLLPCGEGAGYSGGIVSSAIDGINCALAAARSLSGADNETDDGSTTGSSAGFKTGSGSDVEAAGEVGE